MEPETRALYDECLDHGTWNYGMLPGYDAPVTAVITHRDYIVPSYIREHEDYRETVFRDAIETLWGPTPDDAPAIPEVRIPEAHYAVNAADPEKSQEFHFPEGELKYTCHGLSAPFKWAELPWSVALRRGDVEIPCPILIKGYFSDVLVHEDYVEEMRDRFKAFARQRRAEGKARI